MTVWVVMEGDYDGDWIVAIYDSEAVARQHCDRQYSDDYLYIIKKEVVTELLQQETTKAS